MNKIFAAVVIFSLFISYHKVQAVSPQLQEYQNTVELDFPTSINFNAEFGSETAITKIKLFYGSTQDTCGNVSGMALPDFTAGERVTVNWEWDMRQSGGEPPGATIWWQWEIVDEKGNSTLTDRQEITWIDNTHDWQTLSDGLIRLHYYYPDASYGMQLKDAAVEALERLSEDIGIKPNEPIDLYIYSSTQDMQDAVFYEPGWTGGLAYSEYNILIIGIDPFNLEWGKTTEAHELTHVLVGDYTFTCLGSIPTWLNEGLAVYGEGGPDQGEAAYFEQNRDDDTLLTFSVLSGGFSEDPDTADLSYSQSYYMVNYLVQTYGKDKMLALLDEMKNGGEISESLKETYGFDLAGFEDEWRYSLGLGSAEIETETVKPTPTVVPTIQPIQGASTNSGSTAKNAEVTTDKVETALETGENAASMSIIEQITTNLTRYLYWAVIVITVIFLLLLLLILILVLRRKGGQQ